MHEESNNLYGDKKLTRKKIKDSDHSAIKPIEFKNKIKFSSDFKLAKSPEGFEDRTWKLFNSIINKQAETLSNCLLNMNQENIKYSEYHDLERELKNELSKFPIIIENTFNNIREKYVDKNECQETNNNIEAEYSNESDLIDEINSSNYFNANADQYSFSVKDENEVENTVDSRLIQRYEKPSSHSLSCENDNSSMGNDSPSSLFENNIKLEHVNQELNTPHKKFAMDNCMQRNGNGSSQANLQNNFFNSSPESLNLMLKESSLTTTPVKSPSNSFKNHTSKKKETILLAYQDNLLKFNSAGICAHPANKNEFLFMSTNGRIKYMVVDKKNSNFSVRWENSVNIGKKATNCIDFDPQGNFFLVSSGPMQKIMIFNTGGQKNLVCEKERLGPILVAKWLNENFIIYALENGEFYIIDKLLKKPTLLPEKHFFDCEILRDQKTFKLYVFYQKDKILFEVDNDQNNTRFRKITELLDCQKLYLNDGKMAFLIKKKVL